MKIKSTLFIIVVVAIIATISYYVKILKQRASPYHQSTASDIIPMVSKKTEPIETNSKMGKQEIEKNNVDKSLEFQKQDTNSKRQLMFPPNLINPYTILDSQLSQLNQAARQQENRLKQIPMTDQQFASEIIKLQNQYNHQINVILQVKHQLDTVQKLVNEGTITPEAGKEAMWRLVLPEETQKAMFQKLE